MYTFVRKMVITPENLWQVLRMSPDDSQAPLIRLCQGRDTKPAGITSTEWFRTYVQKRCYWLTYPTPAVPDKYVPAGTIITERYPEVQLESTDPHLWDIIESIIRPDGFEMNMITCLEARTVGNRIQTMTYEYRTDTNALNRYLTARTIEMLEGTLQQLRIWIATPGSPIVYTFEHFQDTGHCTAWVDTDVSFPDWFFPAEPPKKETAWLTCMFSDGNTSYHKDGESGYYKSLSFEDLEVGTTAEQDLEYFIPIGRYVVDMWFPYTGKNEEGRTGYLLDIETGEIIDTLHEPIGGPNRSESGTLWVREDVLDAEYITIASYYYPV